MYGISPTIFVVLISYFTTFFNSFTLKDIKMILKKVAAIDVGSNAVRLLITRVIKTPDCRLKFKKELLLRVPLRLGEDSFIKGEISAVLENRLITAMQTFYNLIQEYQVETYCAYATAALREARNGEQIVLDVNQKANIHLRIISGAEEAKLIVESHAAKKLQAGQNFIYVDVGGGSTEIALIIHGTLAESKSFRVGTIRLLNEKVAAAEMDDLLNYLRLIKKKYNPAKILGLGGNINKVYRLVKTAKKRILTVQKLRKIYHKLELLSVEERMSKYELKPDRADVIVPACEIFLAIAGVTGITEIFVPNLKLVDGMTRSILEAEKSPDSVTSL